ncbi:MAG: shikimate dehydrogenase [Erythrobacter sp.]
MSTARAEVIGDPIAQSKSPIIHRFWLKQLGRKEDYIATRVEPAGLGDYFAKARMEAGWLGCNVTMPLKEAVIAHCDALDPLAARLGAVNTVARREDGSLLGLNTDAAGFLEPLRPVLEEQHLFRMARICGTGGAARAIVAALAHEGFTIVLAGRDPGKARAILDALAPTGEHHAIALSHFASATDFAFDDRKGCCDLVINTTPLGMVGQPSLAFNWSHAPPGSIAYDIVTHPPDTPFLQDARAAGFKTIGGLAMLVGQAARAFEAFFGERPPRGSDDALMRELRQ